MIVAILLSPDRSMSEFEMRYVNILKHNSIDHEIVTLRSSMEILSLAKYDICIYRWLHLPNDHYLASTVIPVLENELGINCFPNQKTSWHYDDKIREYIMLTILGYPMIESFIYFEKDAALEWAVNAEYPVVFKLRGGAGSTNIYKIKTTEEAIKTIKDAFNVGFYSNQLAIGRRFTERMFQFFNQVKYKVLSLFGIKGRPLYQKYINQVYFQRYMQSNQYDTRVTTIGNRAFAFRRMNRKNDFRSSGSGIIDYNHSQIDIRHVQLALKISKENNFQTMAYDMLYNAKNEPVICEISYTYEDIYVQRCEGFWDDKLTWHEGHYWPQLWHLRDLLGNQLLAQPDDYDEESS